MQNRASMQDFVISLLKNNIPSEYTYHNYEHTLYVQQKVKDLAAQLHIAAHETMLLDTAALWHDTGYINVYQGHEEESCRLATQQLPGYGFNAGDIEAICGMIMATKVPQKPMNLLQEIIADADLAYLGTNEVAAIAENLFLEMQFLSPELTRAEWNKKQVSFLENHQYFTSFYQRTREPLKQRYLDQLRTSITSV